MSFLRVALFISLLQLQTSATTCNLPFFKDTDGNWHQCPQGCLLCTSHQQCSQCANGYYLVSDECNECDTSCATCETTETNCLSCSTLGFYPILYENTCLHQCPNHFFFTQGTCAQCDANCKQCSDTPTACIQCQPTEVLTPENTCITCPQNHFNQNGECVPCDSSCAACQESSTKCTDCPEGTLLVPSTNSCQVNCPPGFFKSSAKLCSACDQNCVECANLSKECTKCEYDRQLSASSECEDPTCEEGFYDLKNAQCSPCNTNCVKCVNTATQCMECDADSGYLLDHLTRTCVQQCPSGTHSDGEECIVCERNCQSCEQDPSICSSCIDGLKLYEGECLKSCPTKTYEDDQQICQPCAGQCKECIGPAANQCSHCPPNHINKLGQCQSCGDNQYASENNTCEPCQSPCATCLSTTHCLSCQDNSFILYNGSCYSECPSGTYNSNGNCEKCEAPCNDCSSSDVCLSCQLSGESPKLYQGQCHEQCPEETWDDNHTCRPCDQNCSSCKGSATHCTSCPQNLPTLDTTSNTCLASCQNGQFLNAGKCYPCCSPCQQCNFPSHCTACASDSGLPYLLPSESTCVAQCPSSTWLDGSKCSPCAQECTQCETSANTCSACKTGFYISQSNCLQCNQQCTACEGAPDNCVLTCPNGTYESSDGSCQSCQSPCRQCSSQSQCTSCVPGYYFEAPSSCTQCTESSQAPECQNCEDGTYFDGQQCSDCSEACSTCNGPQSSDCIECHTNYFRSSSGVCLPCTAPCNSCLGSASACSSCIQGFYLENNTCNLCNQACKTCEDASRSSCSTCSDGFYQPIGTAQCVECNAACKTCLGAGPNTCESCSSGYFQNEQQICQRCDTSCAQCEGPSPQECTQCPPGHAHINEQSCTSCSLNCLECDSPSPTDCIECLPHHYLAQEGCEACHPICLHCRGHEANECTQCSEEFVLFESYCVTQCPIGSVQIEHECMRCQQSKCSECEPHDTSKCTSCHPASNYVYLVNGECLDKCPPQFYEYQKECYECPSSLPSDLQRMARSLLSCSFSLTRTQRMQVLSLIENTKAQLLKSPDPPIDEISNLIELTSKSLISMPRQANTTLVGIILVKKSLATSYDFTLDSGDITGIKIQIHIPLPRHNSQQLVSAIFHDPLFPGSLPGVPLVDINVYDSSTASNSFTPITNQTISLIFTFNSVSKPSGPITCSFWNKVTQMWSAQGITTESIGSNIIMCTTSHLSSFSVVRSQNGVVVGQDNRHKAQIIFQFFCFFFLGLVLVNLSGCFCDICTFRSKREHYPHKAKIATTTIFRVFCYSLLYNLHIISVFSYRSQLILCTFKAFWVSDLFLTIFYVLELMISSQLWLLALVIFILGFSLCPNSILQFCLLQHRRQAVIQFSEQDVNKDYASDRSSKDFVPTQSLHFARSNSALTEKQRYTYNKVMIAVLCIFTFLTYGAAIGITFLKKEEVANHFNKFFISLGVTYGIGLLLSLIKILLASCSATKYPRSCCLNATFVDFLTTRIVEDGKLIHAKKRQVIEFHDQKAVADIYGDSKGTEQNHIPPAFPEQSFGLQVDKQNAL